MHAFRLRIKTWNPSLNVLTPKLERQLSLASWRKVSWCAVVFWCVDSKSKSKASRTPFITSSRLLDPKHFLLPLLGSRFPLEVAVGVNGRVWMNSKEVKQTIAIARCIEAVDPDGGGLDESYIKKFINTLDLWLSSSIFMATPWVIYLRLYFNFCLL